MREKIIVSKGFESVWIKAPTRNILTTYMEFMFRFSNHVLKREPSSIYDDKKFKKREGVYLLKKEAYEEVNRNMLMEDGDIDNTFTASHSNIGILNFHGFIIGYHNGDFAIKNVGNKFYLTSGLYYSYYEKHKEILNSDEFEIWLRLYCSTCVKGYYIFTSKKIKDYMCNYFVGEKDATIRKRVERMISKLTKVQLIYLTENKELTNIHPADTSKRESWFGLDGDTVEKVKSDYEDLKRKHDCYVFETQELLDWIVELSDGGHDDIFISKLMNHPKIKEHKKFIDDTFNNNKVDRYTTEDSKVISDNMLKNGISNIINMESMIKI